MTLAVVALLVSVASLATAVAAIVTSRRTLARAHALRQAYEAREFETVRSGLLNQISDDRAVFDRARIEIGTLQANFKAEPSDVQAMMVNYTSLFTQFLPAIEKQVRDADELWAQVSAWPPHKTHSELMAARATLYKSLQDSRSAYDSGMYMVRTFAAKLELARQRAADRRAGTAFGNIV